MSTLIYEDTHTQKVLDVYKRRGLQDPFEYALTKMRANLDPQRVREVGTVNALRFIYRDTGRTTFAICRALAYAEDRKRVVILPCLSRHGDVKDLVALVDEAWTDLGSKSAPRALIQVAGARNRPYFADAVQVDENALIINYDL